MVTDLRNPCLKTRHWNQIQDHLEYIITLVSLALYSGIITYLSYVSVHSLY